MSAVKRRLINKPLKEKCKNIRHFEKGMANKEASEKFGVFGVPKMQFQRGCKTKRKFSVHCKKLHCLPKKYVAVITKK